MKHFVCLAATAAVALAVVSGALAATRPTSAKLEPRPQVWPRLRAVPRPQRATRQSSAVQPQGTTHSIYEKTVKPRLFARQGCAAGRRQERGVVVLDFGKPAYHLHGYGTILFSDRFALNHRITNAMLGYARGYARCLPRTSSAFVTLARGTSDYHPSVPSAREAGVRWARATDKLARLLRRRGLSRHVAAAAADDAEPAWDPHFRKTRGFIHGYRSAAHGHALYDYGSLDGGVGAIWSARQMIYVAGGIRHTQALPEIYYPSMAREWADLARVARSRYHSHVRFAGVMTEVKRHCKCGLPPHEAHRALARALASEGVGQADLPHGGTNIVG